MAKSFKPGTNDVPPGEYQETSSRGQPLRRGRQVDVESGERLPPTQEEGNRWRQKE